MSTTRMKFTIPPLRPAGQSGFGPAADPIRARGRVLASPPAVTFPERSRRTVLDMTEGNPVPGQAAADPRARRLRLASQAAVLVALGVVLALIALAWPAAGLARLSVISSTGGGSCGGRPCPSGWWASWWPGASRATRSAGAWSAWSSPAALSQDGSLYAIAGLPAPPRHTAARLGGDAGPARLGHRHRADRGGHPDLPRRQAGLAVAAAGAVAVPGARRGLDGQRLRPHRRGHRPAQHPGGLRRQPGHPQQRPQLARLVERPPVRGLRSRSG